MSFVLFSGFVVTMYVHRFYVHLLLRICLLKIFPRFGLFFPLA